MAGPKVLITKRFHCICVSFCDYSNVASLHWTANGKLHDHNTEWTRKQPENGRIRRVALTDRAMDR